jgi:hypothetical protein
MIVRIPPCHAEMQGGGATSIRPVSSPVPPPDDPVDDGAERAERAGRYDAATEALEAAFARLQPQGSDMWNFLANFVQMGDRYGPPPSAESELTRQLEGTPATPGRRVPTGRRRQAPSGRRRQARAEDAPDELHTAMAQVVEAFRFLSARVRTLEERLAREDRPVEGAAWLIPALDLGGWTTPVVAHLVARVPAGEILHGDCGEGRLLLALLRAGLVARGVEPRGGVALRALEQGLPVSIAEVIAELAVAPAGSLGGLVLSGVVDRLPLHAIVLLLSEARRVLHPGGPIVVVATDPGEGHTDRDVVGTDLLAPSLLHARTWEVLLDRAQFAEVAPLEGGPPGDDRFAVTARVPD